MKLINDNMRFLCFLFFVTTIILTSCKKDEDEGFNCKTLTEGILENKSTIIEIEINRLTADLAPKPTSNDKIGHKENIQELIDLLNSKCNDFETELKCYACIYTEPAQSQIKISYVSDSVSYQKIIDILTPEDNIMKFMRIH